MTFKLTFLGSGSAFTLGDANYQSNILLQKNFDTMLIDAGGDLRFSLNEQGLSYMDIRNIYITHLHADHIGGLEWLAISTFFDANYHGKPQLYCEVNILNDLWDKSLSGGLSTLKTQKATLNTFFDTHPIAPNGKFSWQGISFELIQADHLCSDNSIMPCYGLLINNLGKYVYITADTQYSPQKLLTSYEMATLIFHDCETAKHKTGVHAHYSELNQLELHLKKKMWLYHYNPGALPDAEADGFLGFIKKGQSFLI